MAEGNAYALAAAAAAAAKEQNTSNKSTAVQQTEEVQLAEMVNQEACSLAKSSSRSFEHRLLAIHIHGMESK